MRSPKSKPVLFFAIICLFSCCGRASAQTLTVTTMSPTSGPVGTLVTIVGTHFGTAQGSSTVSLNGTTAGVVTWSDSTISVLVPSGASSGTFTVTVSGQTANTSSFTVIPLPSGWSDGDVGSVGLAGSASFANGIFTVAGAGQGTLGSADGMHCVYQSLSGDGTIVARVASLPSSSAQAGVMIRETLTAGATNMFAFDYQSLIYQSQRITTGAGATYQSYGSGSVPYWVKVVRSGSTFTGYSSLDGVNWSQLGTSQTISMAQSVYIGLGVSSRNTSALATATFDNVSLSTPSTPGPIITTVSATTVSVGSQVLVSGSGFGASEGSSVVLLNDALVTVNAWTDGSIVVTIPSGATSGPLVVSVGPSMNDSNAVKLTLTSQPLPIPWLDQDVGAVGLVGSATFANEVFTVTGAGAGYGTSDAMHFVYQSISGDGTIVARLLSVPAGTEAGVMIRETLASGAANMQTDDYQSFIFTHFRSSTGGSTASSGQVSITLPYWVKLVRSGNTFSAYYSSDGVNWVQVGTSQTITMAQKVCIGLAVSSHNASSLATFTFDNVSLSTPSAPAPIITGLSATTGSVGSQVVISGSGFGASQGGSVVTLHGALVAIYSWSNTSIVILIPTGATTGPLVVSVAPSMNDSNPEYFTITTQPLPIPWLDQDVGAVGLAGSATYSNGVFTVNGAGSGTFGTADGIHFVYQTLSGDGSIVARVVSSTAGTQAGVMIRETLASGATNLQTSAYHQSFIYLFDRTSTAGSTTYQNYGSRTLPYWIRVVRNGSTFSGYTSSDGATWVQAGSNVTITMAQNAYVGLVESSNSTSSLATSTFDNVAVTTGTTPIVTGLTPTVGPLGTTVTIAGSNFGATQGTSTLTFNGTLATSITSWSNTQIVTIVPAGATTGLVNVIVNSIQGISTSSFTVVHPVIIGLAPPAAEVGGLVTVNGSGFGAYQNSSQVQINGVVAAVAITGGQVGWSDTSVTVGVPSNATSGPVTVTVDGVTSNSVQFTLIPHFSVTAVSPNIGPVGTSVTITGVGFGATQSNSTASFYGATATITSWSDTQIVGVVPAGASTGPVSVVVAGILAQGPSFTLTSATLLTDSLGNSTTYTAAVVGGVWYASDMQGSGCSSCTERGVVHNTFDALGNVVGTTDALGHVTTYTYDANGNVSSVTVPITSSTSATTSYTYNSFGSILTTTDPLGHVTTNTYDTHGNLLTVTTPAPNGNTAASVTTFTYDTKGELLTIKDPLTNVTTLTYYPTGLINSITDAQNNVTTYVYDSHGNRTSATDAMNNQTTFAYDAGDRLKTITYPGSTGTTTFGYDYRGRRTSVTDQNSKTTTYAYDDADRLTSVTDAATPGNVTTYGYDTESNLTSITDANNHQTTFNYDAFGRVTKTTFPSTLIETYGYDANNNLTSKTDRKNQLITYTYDQLNRLTKKTYPDNSTVNYTLDNDSRLTQVTDLTGTYQFAFDNMGRLTSTTTSYTFLTGRNFTTSYSYDAASNRTAFTDPESGSTSYVYDALNRLQTLTLPTAFTATGNFGFSYDALSRRTQMTRPNGLKSIYAYDNLSRLLSVLHQSGSTTLDGAAYAVDNAGNRTSRTPQPSGTASNFSYDNMYELTQVTQGVSTTESYTYDPVGNRLSSLGVSPYTVNSSNELTSTPNTTYTYDNNGNTLTKVVGTGGTVTFKYDPFGRRIYKSFSAGTTNIYAYDGDNLVEETNATGAVVARYSQTQNIDEPLAMLRSSATSFYHADGLGSVTSLSSAAGSIANTYTYDSFGNLTASTGSITDPFRYSARESDTETGLYYYRARYYDPTIGRFISMDPIGFKGGDNHYAFVKNNPLLLRDPKGTCPGPLPCTPPPVLDTASAYLFTCPCYGQGDIDKTCQCLALPFAPNDPVFMKQCKGCYGGQSSPRDACKCACTLMGNDKAQCDLWCGFVPKKWPKPK